MRRNTDRRYRGGFYWRCKVKDRAQSHAYYYERMPFRVRGKRLIVDRRGHALKRRRERQERGAPPNG
jgi:hypothetical protein